MSAAYQQPQLLQLPGAPATVSGTGNPLKQTAGSILNSLPPADWTSSQVPMLWGYSWGSSQPAHAGVGTEAAAAAAVAAAAAACGGQHSAAAAAEVLLTFKRTSAARINHTASTTQHHHNHGSACVLVQMCCLPADPATH
jgi:hypothetical protein